MPDINTKLCDASSSVSRQGVGRQIVPLESCVAVNIELRCIPLPLFYNILLDYCT